MLVFIFIVFTIAILCIIYLLFPLDDVKQFIETIRYIIRTEKEEKRKQKELKNKKRQILHKSTIFK